MKTGPPRNVYRCTMRREGWLAAVWILITACAGCSSPTDARPHDRSASKTTEEEPEERSPAREPRLSLAPPDRGALVYLVSDDDYLHSFDPRIPGKAAYASIGKLQCNANAVPQSMAVDRQGMAWVFYGSGQLYRVSVSDGSCTPTSYRHPSGMTQLGMGFTSAAPGSSDDVLFVMSPAFGLATVAFPSLSVGQIGKSRLSAELTGAGDGRLFAFTAQNGEISEIDRQTFDQRTLYRLKDAWGAHAWAFSRYAGRFYVFTARGFGHSVCTEVDLDRHTETVRDADVGFVVVGAGQSTLVPPRDGGSALPGDGIRDEFRP